MVKTITILSLSAGTIGEVFVSHEVALGLQRLEDRGIRVKFGTNARLGIENLRQHPEARAQDLLDAFQDPETDLILCAIGGDDTYRLLPWLFEQDQLKNALTQKLFLGFSDTTVNHLMLHKLGLNTFYGQSFLADVCELEQEMLPYSKQYFEELLATGRIQEITPSPVWYEERTDWTAPPGTPRIAHSDRGFELLQGPAVFSGPILGGCLDTLYDLFDGTRYADSPGLCRQYSLFPALEDWKGKLLLLESSEEQMPPEKYEKALQALKNTGIFSVINGVLAGKPMDEMYYEEYRALLVRVIGDPKLPILYNINVGHATPRCIIPFGVPATVDAVRQRISFAY